MPTLAAAKRIIQPPVTKLVGSWSYGILVDGTLYVSAMGGQDATGKVPSEFETEVKAHLGCVMQRVENSAAS